jgi:hypothetical protein
VPVPDEVRAACETWLAAIDLRAPALVNGLYLRGGLGFGEYVHGKSDVDFVAVLSRRPLTADLDDLTTALGAVGARHPGLTFDGAHVLASDLARSPEECPDVPVAYAGVLERAARREIQVVAWHELAHHGLTVFGPPLSTLDIWTDDAALRAYTIHNLDTYWRATADGVAAEPVEAGADWVCEWCVLGVARLHHLLVTGEQTTKSGAGRWGLGFYEPRFHRVLHEALRLREGGLPEYTDPTKRGIDVAAFTAYVVDQGSCP